MLNVKNVFHSYPNTKKNDLPISILEDINFTLKNGESISIVGHSGSGKSTLLSLISALHYPTKGDIMIDNQSIISMTEKERSNFRLNYIGIVFQNFYLIPYLTALDNVVIAAKAKGLNNPIEKAKDIIDHVGMSHRFYHKPVEMSGGECQRIAIARALVTEPKLILSDEPTGNLDEDNTKKISDLFFKITKQFNTSLLFVTHNLEIAKRCNQLFYLKNRKLYSKN